MFCKLQRILMTVLVCILVCSGCVNNPSDPLDSTGPIASGGATNASQPAKDWVLPEIDSDFFTLLCGKQDVIFNKLSYTNNVSYAVLSAIPLTTDDLQVTFDAYVPFNYELIMEQEPQKLPDYIFASYQGISWGDVAQLLSDNDAESANALVNPIFEAYNAIPPEQLPSLYMGTLVLAFPKSSDLGEAALKELTVKLGDKSYTYPLEHLDFSQKKIDLPDHGDLICNSLSLVDMNVMPSKDGAFHFNNINLTANAELVIDKITFYNSEQTTISSVEISQKINEDTLNYIWKEGDPLKLGKGDTISISINGYDPIFSNTLIANATRFLLIEYTCNDIPSTVYVELAFRMRQDAFTAYAEMVDGLDILPFYTDYMPLFTQAENE